MAIYIPPQKKEAPIKIERSNFQFRDENILHSFWVDGLSSDRVFMMINRH